jgi:N-acetylmuramoyl-L-alanine amidase
MATVVIDPGHGGTADVGGSSWNNAIGPAGTLEKTLTLDVALKCRDLLDAQGISVHMTRTRDVNLGLADRAHVARDAEAAAFVSIHFNGFDDPQVQGSEALVYTDTSSGAPDRQLASRVLAEVLGRTGYHDRGVKEQQLGVLNPSEHWLGTAACLIEVSFITDPADETRLQDEMYRRNIAEGIAVAIFDFVNGK